jgi:Pyruvate/2-oxoacid:ferredoxin oxidoreductase delta subunit/biotin operon repressor
MVTPGYRTIAEHFGYSDSEKFYRVLERVFSPREALIVAELPSPPEEIAVKLSMDREAVEESVQDLTLRGAITRGSKGYRLAREIVLFRDMLLQTPRLQPPLLDELAEVWEKFMQAEVYENEAARYAARVAAGKEPRGRVVPAIKAIKDLPDVPPDQDLRELLRNREPIGIGLCPCRRQTVQGCSRALDVCFLFDKWAAAAIERGAARKVSYEESLDAVALAEEEGLIHVIGVEEGPVMCSCCNDCCVVLGPLMKYSVSPDGVWAKSDYESIISEEICSGCQDCVDWCPFEAMEMVKVEGSRRLKAAVDLEKCRGCGVCFVKCDDGAIVMEKRAAVAAV